MYPKPNPSISMHKAYQEVYDSLDKTLLALRKAQPKLQHYSNQPNNLDSYTQATSEHKVIYDYFKELQREFGELSTWCLDNTPSSK